MLLWRWILSLWILFCILVFFLFLLIIFIYLLIFFHRLNIWIGAIERLAWSNKELLVLIRFPFLLFSFFFLFLMVWKQSFAPFLLAIRPICIYLVLVLALLSFLLFIDLVELHHTIKKGRLDLKQATLTIYLVIGTWPIVHLSDLAVITKWVLTSVLLQWLVWARRALD